LLGRVEVDVIVSGLDAAAWGVDGVGVAVGVAVGVGVGVGVGGAAAELRREPDLAVRRIGDGVVILAQPDTDRRLPILLGYADARGQWYRDGRRHHQPDQLAPSIADTTGVEL